MWQLYVVCGPCLQIDGHTQCLGKAHRWLKCTVNKPWHAAPVLLCIEVKQSQPGICGGCQHKDLQAASLQRTLRQGSHSQVALVAADIAAAHRAVFGAQTSADWGGQFAHVTAVRTPV